MAIEVDDPTLPVVSTETSFQLLADVQPLEQVVYLRSPLVMSWYDMCKASLESIAMDVRDPTFPTESIVLVVHDDADEHEEEQVAYFRSSLVESRYEMCTASLESMATEEYLPTSPLESTVTFDQEDVDEHDDAQVAYLRSSLVLS